jgi:hypothetical protein
VRKPEIQQADRNTVYRAVENQPPHRADAVLRLPMLLNLSLDQTHRVPDRRMVAAGRQDRFEVPVRPIPHNKAGQLIDAPRLRMLHLRREAVANVGLELL